AEPVDLVDLGLGHLPQELARVAREALDVPPLALGVQRVEGERALARARDAGEADERAAREGQGDVAEVVLAGAADDDVRAGHPWKLLLSASDRGGGAGPQSDSDTIHVSAGVVHAYPSLPR